MSIIHTPERPAHRGVVVEAPDGRRLYRHIRLDLPLPERVSAMTEILDEAGGPDANVLQVRDCPPEDHVSGLANCRHGLRR